MAVMKIARRKTSTTSDVQLIQLTEESKEELKSLLIRVREESEKLA